jgi:hypothetical protein
MIARLKNAIKMKRFRALNERLGLKEKDLQKAAKA